jgi:hypothetical protein
MLRGPKHSKNKVVAPKKKIVLSCDVECMKFCTVHLKLFLKKTARWLFVSNTMMGFYRRRKFDARLRWIIYETF